MRYILSLKHWQLFITIFLPSILVGLFSIDILGMWHVITSVWGIMIYLLWLYTVGITFNTNFNKTVLLFKACFFYNVIWILIFSGYNSESAANTLWQILCILVGLFSSFYMIYFATKSLVFFRENNGDRDVSFSRLFLCFWFFPIGVWLLQPGLNKYMYDRYIINTIGPKGNEGHV
jgi:hypothetical protein